MTRDEYLDRLDQIQGAWETGEITAAVALGMRVQAILDLWVSEMTATG
jgi:hypothetical protein